MNLYNKRLSIAVILISMCITANAQPPAKTSNGNNALRFFKADHPYIQFTGRIDFSNRVLPRFWNSGVYIRAKFKGTSCEIVMNDEVNGDNHNYLEIVIDDKKPFRIKTTGKTNTIKAAGGLTDGDHTITICKNTESGIGYLEFVGLRCKDLVRPGDKPLRKIEFVGNSITSGAGSDLSVIACDQGQWYDQHNAYMSYGATTARNLNAQWHLTSVSGIGLIHSCCNMTITMPQVFDKMNPRSNSIQWNFNNYQPQVVTICLGQNDGAVDSTKFCSAYVTFIADIRKRYPRADIVCLNSPMADASLTAVLKNYINGVVSFVNKKGDKKVSKFYFSKRYNRGCGGHPNIDEHREIADELTGYIRKLKGW
ncbi:MAG: acetyl xylan esterase [Segetibacter sp.]|nr:acetyl xylan esterase [Segetibacter sp.]